MNIKENEILLFFKGKNDKAIGYDAAGKIVLSRNKTSVGFKKIKNIKERDTYYLCDTESIPYDYYDGMDYVSFKEMIKYNNFKIAFEYPFIYKGKNEMMVVAYHIPTHIIIVAETWDNMQSFNAIRCYCPGVNGNRARSILFEMGSNINAVFNVCLCHSHRVKCSYFYPLHSVVSMSLDSIQNGNSIEIKQFPHTWNYADDLYKTGKFSTEETKKRFLQLSPDEFKEWFKNVE